MHRRHVSPTLEYPRSPGEPCPRRRAATVGTAVPGDRAAARRRTASVLVAPSTAQDPQHALLRAAVEGLGGEPLRLLAAWNRRQLAGARKSAREHSLGRVDLVFAHDAAMRAGDLSRRARHDGAVARARRAGGRRTAFGDMAEERSPRGRAGAGVRMPWRLLSPRTLRLVVRAALADGRSAGGGLASSPRGPGESRRAERAADLARGVARLVASARERGRGAMNSGSSSPRAPSARRCRHEVNHRTVADRSQPGATRPGRSSSQSLSSLTRACRTLRRSRSLRSGRRGMSPRPLGGSPATPGSGLAIIEDRRRDPMVAGQPGASPLYGRD